MNQVLAAYSAHAGLNAAGVRIYDADEIPSVTEAIRVATGTPPTPVVIPVFEFSTGLNLPTSTDGVGDQSFTANFLMLISPAVGERGLPVVTPRAMAAAGAYFDAMAANPDLSDTLAADAEVQMTARPRQIGDDWWFVVEIVHTWQFFTEDD